MGRKFYNCIKLFFNNARGLGNWNLANNLWQGFRCVLTVAFKICQIIHQRFYLFWKHWNMFYSVTLWLILNIWHKPATISDHKYGFWWIFRTNVFILTWNTVTPVTYSCRVQRIEHSARRESPLSRLTAIIFTFLHII